MGYRSDVKFIIDKKNEADFEALFNEEKNEIEPWWDSKFNIASDPNLVGYEAEWIKWYYELEEIKVTHNFMVDLNVKDEYFEFMRIGESDTDIDYRVNIPWESYYDTHLGLVRRFEVY